MLTRFIERLRRRYLPPPAAKVVDSSIQRAKQQIGARPLSVLVDNSVLSIGVIHETAWVSSGESTLPGLSIKPGYSARVPIYSPNDTSEVYQNVLFLPGITALARQGAVQLMTSAELAAERFRQPNGRFRGYGLFDNSLFDGFEFPSIDGPPQLTMGPKYLGLPTIREQQHQRLRESKDGLYGELLTHFGPTNDQDAWHVQTAERNGQFCFLTMDFKLCNLVRAHQHHEPFLSLKTRVMTPREFGEHFGIRPVPPHLLIYTNPKGPVSNQISGKTGRRFSRKRYERLD